MVDNSKQLQEQPDQLLGETTKKESTDGYFRTITQQKRERDQRIKKERDTANARIMSTYGLRKKNIGGGGGAPSGVPPTA